MSAQSFRFYLGTEIDGPNLNAEQLFVRQSDLNDLLGTTTFTEALFHILLGSRPTEDQRKLFDLVLVAFHGGFGLLPPTTLVPRIVAGTGVSTPQALAAGYLASGPYHVGAVEQAMHFYQQILRDFEQQAGSEPRTARDLEAYAWTRTAELIDRREVVPGYGHPLLRRDPRPTRLRRVVCDLKTEGPYLDIYDGVVRCVSEKKSIPPNVDGMTGAILLTLGFRPEHGTGLFLLARTAAMLAHILEEQTDMPYQTLKRFMFMPVAMPRLFNADFKKITRLFNRMRDRGAFRHIRNLFTSRFAKPFVEKAQADQEIIDAALAQRAAKPLAGGLGAEPASGAPRDAFVAGVQPTAAPPPESVSDDRADEDSEVLDLAQESSPDLLAAAALFLSASLQREQTGAGDSTSARTQELLQAALNLISEASAALDGGRPGSGTGRSDACHEFPAASE